MLLPAKGKILALDIGSHRTGVAISDENQKVAFIRNEIVHSNRNELIYSIKNIVDEERISGIIVGMPIGMDGLETKQSKYTHGIIDELKEANINVISLDERLTSKEAAKQGLHDLNSRSAQILLQTYFNSTSTPGNTSP